MEDDPRLQRCGFAKLQGPDLEHIVRKYEIKLGRRSKAALDVPLGDSMSLSREHAVIRYNFEAKQWELRVLGKNGASVNGTLQTPASDPKPLSSGDVIQMGDRSFHFLLPRSTPSGRAPTAARGSGGGAAAAAPAQASDPLVKRPRLEVGPASPRTPGVATSPELPAAAAAANVAMPPAAAAAATVAAPQLPAAAAAAAAPPPQAPVQAGPALRFGASAAAAPVVEQAPGVPGMGSRLVQTEMPTIPQQDAANATTGHPALVQQQQPQAALPTFAAGPVPLASPLAHMGIAALQSSQTLQDANRVHGAAPAAAWAPQQATADVTAAVLLGQHVQQLMQQRQQQAQLQQQQQQQQAAALQQQLLQQQLQQQLMQGSGAGGQGQSGGAYYSGLPQ